MSHGGGGSEKCQNSVTYYLNGPLVQYVRLLVRLAWQFAISDKLLPRLDTSLPLMDFPLINILAPHFWACSSIYNQYFSINSDAVTILSSVIDLS